MEEGVKKIFMTLGVAGILFLSVFVVTTYSQLSKLNEANEEKKGLPLLASISVDETKGTVPFEVKYTPLVLNAEGNVKYEWDFGDGTKSNEINPTHIYEKDGFFICNLTVIDSSRKEKSDTVEITAKKNEAPIATIKIDDANIMRDYIPILPQLADPFSGRSLHRLITYNIVPDSWLNIDGLVHCNAQVSDPEGDEIVSYNWVLTKPIITAISGSIQPKYTFEGENVTFPLLYTYGDGQYDVQLTVIDSAGNNATVNIPFKVEKSSFETTSNYLIKTVIIEKFLNTLYAQYLPPDVQHMISDPLWELIFGPLEDFSYDLLNNTVLPYIPEKAQSLVLKLYYMVFGMIEQKFPRPYEAANLFFPNISGYNFSTNVELDGSVNSDASKDDALVIVNNDAEKSAENLYIMLEKPSTGESGLAEELETASFEVSVKIGSHIKKMFYEGEYRDCFITDNLAVDDEINVNIEIILHESDPGTFTRGTYENTLYIYQKDAKYIDEATFTVTI